MTTAKRTIRKENIMMFSLELAEVHFGWSLQLLFETSKRTAERLNGWTGRKKAKTMMESDGRWHGKGGKRSMSKIIGKKKISLLWMSEWNSLEMTGKRWIHFLFIPPIKLWKMRHFLQILEMHAHIIETGLLNVSRWPCWFIFQYAYSWTKSLNCRWRRKFIQRLQRL